MTNSELTPVTLHISQAFRNGVFPLRQMTHSAARYTDYTGLLEHLELLLGCGGYSTNTKYLRVELYRQSLAQWLELNPATFYHRSYRVDRFATAQVCLEHRDALVSSGFQFGTVAGAATERLAVFCGVEEIFLKKISNREHHKYAFGLADRFRQVTQNLKGRKLNHSFQAICFHDPQDLVPVHIRHLTSALGEAEVLIEWMEQPTAITSPNSDLATFIAKIADPNLTQQALPKQDGSLIVLRTPHDASAASWLAQWLKQNNEAQKPSVIAATGQSFLARSLQAEGLPVIGITSSSTARPSLQIIKLAPCFLWQPFDVYKVMEFVNLPITPLHDELAATISTTLAEKPGFDSELWFARVHAFLNGAAPDVVATYLFLFKRNRYDSDSTVPRREVLELYLWIADWASEQTNSDNVNELNVLAAQARRICDLLEALPDTRLTFLEVEHIIRTVFEPVPVQITSDSINPYEICTSPGALLYPAETVIWWNCVDLSSPPRPDFWTRDERLFLTKLGVHPDAPTVAHHLDKWLQIRPLRSVTQRLVIVVPAQIAGENATPHPLLSQLEACWSDANALIVELLANTPAKILEKYKPLPKWFTYPITAAKAPEPFLNTADSLQIHAEEQEESFTRLESLLYYPHNWFLQNHLKLRGARLTDIKSDETLLGNLAHRFFEDLLPNPQLLTMLPKDISAWMETVTNRILEEEGATLLLYGREIERQQFLHKLRRSLQVFVQMLQNNGWRVKQVEHTFTGKVLDIPIRCRTDVILTRGNELAILDLKWAGMSRRYAQINNGEDVQLITYARALEPIEYWPHTGFYIISEAKLLMRNRDAFDNAIVPGKPSESPHETIAQQIFDRLEATLSWRLQQLRSGQIEVRTTDTFQELEEIYGGILQDLLNLPSESGKYDPFLTLVYGS